jgi:hypothetical protein
MCVASCVLLAAKLGLVQGFLVVEAGVEVQRSG